MAADARGSSGRGIEEAFQCDPAGAGGCDWPPGPAKQILGLFCLIRHVVIQKVYDDSAK